MADVGHFGSIFTQFLVVGSRDPTVSGLRVARSPTLNLRDPQFWGSGVYISRNFCGNKGLQFLLSLE